MRLSLTRFCVFLLVFALSGQVAASTSPEALEAFSLDELRVVGIYLGNNNSFRQSHATIMDPKGYIHYVIRGSYLGKDRSMVKSFHKDHVVISQVRDQSEEFVKLPLRRRVDSN